MNNWDLKQVNNAIYEVDGERHYVVSDARRHVRQDGQRGDAIQGRCPRTTQDSKFIAKVTPDFVDFVLHSRPFFLSVFARLQLP